jgi:hypothetical protein
MYDESYDTFSDEFDSDFEQAFQADQARKWATGEYVNHCEGCAGEDCPCCQFNPNL